MRLLFLLTILGACADKTPPSWPEEAQLEASEVGARTIALRWPQASDETGVHSYSLLKDGQDLAGVGPRIGEYNVDGLDDLTEYRFTIRAVDEAENESEPLHVTVTTADGTAPMWPRGAFVRATAGDGVVDVEWSPAQDNAQVVAYRLYRGAARLAEVEGTSHQIQGDDTTQLSVTAVDAAGNVSRPIRPSPLRGDGSTADAPDEATQTASVSPQPLDSQAASAALQSIAARRGIQHLAPFRDKLREATVRSGIQLEVRPTETE